MKISLVFPPFFLESMYNLPPLGLIGLATALHGQGREVVIVDLVLELRLGKIPLDRHFYRRCAERVLASSPHMVAFSAQCTTYPPVIRIANEIKKMQPEVKLVIGGHNASFADAASLEAFPWIDTVIRGEGEQTLCELARAYGNGRNEAGIRGVTWRRAAQVVRNPDRPLVADLDALPIPDYHLAPPLSLYRDACGLPRSIAILEVGRGCPHRCVYCSESVLWQRRTRTFSVGRLLREMQILHETHGAECFLLAYDQFTAKRAFVEAFCRGVIEAGLHHLPWYCISRLDTVDAPVLALMREAGCESLCYGIDSGSARTLAFIGKHIDEGILYQRVRETTEAGIVPTLSFVVGFPEEMRRDIDETLLLALKTGVQGNSNPLIQMPTVLPGTRLHDRYLSTLVRQVDTYFSLGIAFDGGLARLPGDEELINAHPAIFSSFYNLPSAAMPLEELDGIARFFPLLVNLYPKGFLLLCLALQRSVAALFFEWMTWVAAQEGRERLELTPAECYRHFEGFARSRLGASDGGASWGHLPEVISYETRAIEAAGPHRLSVTATVDISGASDWAPVRAGGVVRAAFTRNLPKIVSDMKAGRYERYYGDERVFLVFRQMGSELEVLEINDFGKDFLDLCDGGASLRQIAEKLHPLYGERQAFENFVALCRQTADQLADIQLLAAAGPTLRAGDERTHRSIDERR